MAEWTEISCPKCAGTGIRKTKEVKCEACCGKGGEHFEDRWIPCGACSGNKKVVLVFECIKCAGTGAVFQKV